MKKFWSRFVTMAALGCLLVVWALPALAYYPPLASTTTATKIKGHEVACEVRDPQDGYHGTIFMYVKELVQANGVIAMVRIMPSEFIKRVKSVTCVTYDPARKEFVEDTQGGYKEVYQLKVADGVVAYIATDLEDQPAFHYATYDPVEGGWRHQKWDAWHNTSVIPKPQDMEVDTKEGVVTLYWVTYIEKPQVEDTWVAGDIYDGMHHDWQSKLSPGNVGFLLNGQDQFQVKSYWIQDASVHGVIGIAKTSDFDSELKYGYDYTDQKWHEGSNTKLMAYFTAQPAQPPGSDPLWIWFTDMSIGGTNWHWNFGDGNQGTQRSPDHKYAAAGSYSVLQEIRGAEGTNDSHSETIAVGP